MVKSIRDCLSNLKDQLVDAHFEQSLAPSIISQYLDSKLSGARISQRFLAGQVNFCTLMPMRSIPFKTVCLLGMNDGVYPRSMPTEGFDLMTGRVRPGDRSRRDDDRYLFLEALLSAQQCLYISYVGRSIQDNTERVPSVLVSELMEYCQQNYCLQGEQNLGVDESGKRLLSHIKFSHAMVPFSPLAFREAGGSYAKEWLPALSAQGQEVSDMESIEERTMNPSASDEEPQTLSDYLLDATFPIELDLVELQRFWRLPVQYFYNRRLKVVFEPPQAVMQDDEPFILNGLESYQLRDQLLDELLSAQRSGQNDTALVFEQFVKHQRAQGKLPVGAFGDLEFETNRVQAEQIAQELGFICASPQDDIDINLSIDVLGEGKTVHLVGWLTQNYQPGLVRYRSGKVRSQDYLSAWIDHLAMSASGHLKTTHILGYDRKEGVVHLIYPPLESSDYAKGLLSELVRLFYQGMNEPLAYFPRTALAGVEAGFSRGKWVDDEEKCFKKMEGAFNDGYMMSGEGSDPYIARVWSQWNDELAAQSRTLTGLVLQTPRLNAKSAFDD